MRRSAVGGTLILGGGFAGSYVARLLGRRGATIVSRENFMLFTPLLPEAASGTLEPRHVVVPLRQMCRHAELLLGSATRIDEEARTAEVETDTGIFTVESAEPRRRARRGAANVADTGSRRARPRLQGPRRRDRPPEPRPPASSRRRMPTLDAAERERQLGFVFVGAGYAGVEALAELCDLAHDALRYYPRLRQVRQRWVLVDAAPRILPEIPTRLGEYAARELIERGIEVRVSTKLASVDEREAVLSTGERIPARTLVWTAGVKASPRWRASGSRSTIAGGFGSTGTFESRGGRTSGRWATPPPSRTRRRRAAPTRRRASTRCDRRAGWQATWEASWSRTVTGCSVRWRRSGATRASQRSSA